MADKAEKMVEDGYVLNNSGKWITVEKAVDEEEKTDYLLRDGQVFCNSRWTTIELAVKINGFVENPFKNPLLPPNEDDSETVSNTGLKDDDTREIDVAKVLAEAGQTVLPPADIKKPFHLHGGTEILNLDRIGNRRPARPPEISLSNKFEDEDLNIKSSKKRTLTIILFVALLLAAVAILVFQQYLF